MPGEIEGTTDVNTISPRRRYKGLQVGIWLGAAAAVAEFVTACVVYGFSGGTDVTMAVVCGIGTLVVCAAAWELWLNYHDYRLEWPQDGDSGTADGDYPRAAYSAGSADNGAGRSTPLATDGREFDWYFTGADPVADTAPAASARPYREVAGETGREVVPTGG